MTLNRLRAFAASDIDRKDAAGFYSIGDDDIRDGATQPTALCDALVLERPPLRVLLSKFGTEEEKNAAVTTETNLRLIGCFAAAVAGAPGHAAAAVLHALAREGSIDPSVVTQAISLHGLDTEIDDPGRPDTVPAPGSSVGWAN